MSLRKRGKDIIYECRFRIYREAAFIKSVLAGIGGPDNALNLLQLDTTCDWINDIIGNWNALVWLRTGVNVEDDASWNTFFNMIINDIQADITEMNQRFGRVKGQVEHPEPQPWIKIKGFAK